MTKNPDPEDLWIILKGKTDRIFLLGNSHTFPGRMYAKYNFDEPGFSVSKYEIAEASDLAWAWIAGFLSGNQPELHEFLGVSEQEASNIPDDDPAIARWRNAIACFEQEGAIHFLFRRPSKPFSYGSDFSKTPWIVAGEQVWIWTGNCWQIADPQPNITNDWNYLLGTLCESRSEHDNLVITESDHLVCPECSCTTEL